jgi:hypothetical protein
MNYGTIKKLQKEYGFNKIQAMIDNGTIWQLEGYAGRQAMNHLRSGACMLPKIITTDIYGNRLPARQMVEAGTTGSFQNSVRFWTAVDQGEIELHTESEY